jgi:signal transduction histidine kinase
MKLTRKLEAEVLKVYNTYWESYTTGDIKTFAGTLDKTFEMIGTSESEICHTKEDGIKFLKAQIKELVGKVEMRNRKITVVPAKEYVLVNERCDIYVQDNQDWSFYSKIRISTFLRKTASGWKVFQQHGSFPDMRVQEGETLALKKVHKENLQLRDAIRRRTIELEEKNRELEIESALEKVRSVAMGMKKREDMLQICKTISQQLAKLGIKEIRNVQTAIFYVSRQVYMNYEFYAKHDKTFITETSYTNHRIHRAFAMKMLKGKGQFYKTHIKGKKVKDWIAYQKTTNVFIDKYLNTASSLNYYWHSLGPVALGISTYAPLTKESSELFLRFLKVFELAYRRYLDIEKAEAQAREAQMEAALERVRAGAMAMHSSNELNEVVHELRKQMGLLGQKGLETCVIHLHDESPDFIHSWAAIKPPGTESVILESRINVPKNGLLIIEEAMEAYDSNRQDYIIINEGKKLKQWFSFLKKESPIGYNKLMESVKGDIRKLRAFWSFADFAGGSLIMVTMDEPDGPTRTMLRRFANVFGLAYRRFADLKQAEAQAREAQIEAALERVRSRSMAMHKSDELKEVIRLVLEQFIHLNIKAEHAGFYIDYKAHDDMHIWLADPNLEPFYAVIPYFDTPTWNSFLEAKAKEITLHTDLLDFETKNQFYRSLFKLFPVPEEAKKFYLACKGLAVSTVLLDSVGLYIENFDGTPYTDEENNILLRFGKVFQQTYTRFLDLQKAEAQAREAQIEAALERVRSRSLAMHKSDELLEVVAIIFEQLKKLGLQLWNCAIIRFQSKQSYEGEIWMSRPDGKMMQQSFIIPMDKVPVYKKLYDAWRDKKEFHVEFLQDMEIVKHHNRIASLNIFPIDKIKQAAGRELPRQMFFHSINFSDGILGVITTEAVGDETLLLRFGNTFKQAYTRYLDLQKAETQAKEAQIEAALERVRSRTMAMHQSRELNEAAELLYQELSKLGIEKLTCGFTLLDDKTGLGTCYMANPEGSFTWEPFRLNHTGSPVFNLMYESWKKQEPYHLYELAGQVNIDHNKYLAETADNFPIPSEQLLAILPPVTFSNSFNFRYGYLLVVSLSPLVNEQCQLIGRFARVFEQTYTRFLDLQKAEAQALQAEQDLIAIKEAKQKAEEALTELQATQKQLIQSEKMASLGELTAGIAHEIQNPLNFVNNFSEVSKELLDEMKQAMDKGDTEDAKEIMNDVIQNLEKINHHGKRADGIVKGMLQHSRNSSGQKELTDINALCDEYLRLAYHGLRAKDKSFNAKFETNFDETVGKLNVIPQDIGRVVLNLINNAFYAVSERKKLNEPGYEPTVSVSSFKDGNTIRIKVSDNGTGIPQKVLDKIFQPFFTTKPTGQGTGLGLSLSYDIVKAHGGELKVETRGGEGTEFIILLPG